MADVILELKFKFRSKYIDTKSINDIMTDYNQAAEELKFKILSKLNGFREYKVLISKTLININETDKSATINYMVEIIKHPEFYHPNFANSFSAETLINMLDRIGLAKNIELNDNKNKVYANSLQL